MYALRSNLIGFQASVRLVKRIDRSVSLVLLAFFSLLTLLSFFPIQFMTLADNLAGAMVAYTDVLPGQPRSAAEQHGFTCASRSGSVPPLTYCTLRPSDGPFAAINLQLLTSDQRIQEISFLMRHHHFRVGDLELLEDMQYLSAFPDTLFYVWNGYFVTVSTDTLGTRRTYFQRINHISISERPLVGSRMGVLP